MVDRIARNYPVDVPLVGDAQTISIELIYHIHRMLREGHAPASKWDAEPAIQHGDVFYDEPGLRTSPSKPVTPQRWRNELTQLLPDDAIVFSDIGGHMLFNIHDLRIGARQDFMLNLGFGSMGHGTCAPVGAALTEPARPVVAIIGDACFTMNGLDLLTAAEYQVDVLWIVENNQMHGITWHGSKLVGDGTPMDSVRYRRPLDVARDRARDGNPGVDRRSPRWALDRTPGGVGADRPPSRGSPCRWRPSCPHSVNRAKAIAGFRDQ